MADDRTITLPSGGTVQLRAATDLRTKDKMLIRGQALSTGFSGDGLMSYTLYVMAAALVESWDIPYLPGAKIPRDDPDIFGELQPADSEEITNHTEILRGLSVIFPGRITPDDAGVPESPIEPSAD